MKLTFACLSCSSFSLAALSCSSFTLCSSSNLILSISPLRIYFFGRPDESPSPAFRFAAISAFRISIGPQTVKRVQSSRKPKALKQEQLANRDGGRGRSRHLRGLHDAGERSMLTNLSSTRASVPSRAGADVVLLSKPPPPTPAMSDEELQKCVLYIRTILMTYSPAASLSFRPRASTVRTMNNTLILLHAHWFSSALPVYQPDAPLVRL